MAEAVAVAVSLEEALKKLCKHLAEKLVDIVGREEGVSSGEHAINWDTM